MPELDINWWIVFVGCCAGLLPDIVRFAKDRHNLPPPEYLRSWTYWVGLLFLVFLGGLATALAGVTTEPQAIATGYAAPEFISKLVSQQGQSTVKDKRSPPVLPGPAPASEAPQKFSLRNWWAK